MLGALGNCGMACCCRRYLRKFAPVTIKMAKEQNLFLNPSKISGICGRLLCCLSFEQDNYDFFHRSCPKLGKRYQTSLGPMRVLRGNMFRNTIFVMPDTGQEVEYTLDEWDQMHPQRLETPASPIRETKSTHDSYMENIAHTISDDNFAEIEPIEPNPFEATGSCDNNSKNKRRRRKHANTESDQANYQPE